MNSNRFFTTLHLLTKLVKNMYRCIETALNHGFSYVPTGFSDASFTKRLESTPDTSRISLTGKTDQTLYNNRLMKFNIHVKMQHCLGRFVKSGENTV